MTDQTAAFVGDIPHFYDTGLGPMIFVDYADDMARRAGTAHPQRVLDHLFDADSILELRPRYGGAAVTALARIEGIPVGVIASQPTYLGGAIHSPTSDKIARFIQLSDAHDLPIVLLVDAGSGHSRHHSNTVSASRSPRTHDRITLAGQSQRFRLNSDTYYTQIGIGNYSAGQLVQH